MVCDTEYHVERSVNRSNVQGGFWAYLVKDLSSSSPYIYML